MAEARPHLVFDWTEDQVWVSIRKSGVRYHEAYDLGMSRLSCCFCIFASRSDLLVSAKANPELLDLYCDLEAKIDHTFRYDLSLAEIRDESRMVLEV